jgi:hypothetical protein
VRARVSDTFMQTLTQHVTHARALRADILGAPTLWLPRRDILLEWLNGFLSRAEKSRYELGETEAGDLVALEQFLRKRKIPTAQ